MPPTNAQYDSQLEMLAQVVELKAKTGKEAAEIIRGFKTVKTEKQSENESESTLKRVRKHRRNVFVPTAFLYFMHISTVII